MTHLLSLTQTQGYLLLGLYGAFMIAITYFFARSKKYKSIQGFLVAGRNVKWWLGATSIKKAWLEFSGLPSPILLPCCCLYFWRQKFVQNFRMGIRFHNGFGIAYKANAYIKCICFPISFIN